jgi:4a-hydroxytetrahydrobiopterin dehydratase
MEPRSGPLADRKCVPCRGGVPPLPPDQVRGYLAQIPDWEARENRRIFREYRFRDFRTALEFTNQVGRLAEDLGHHPDLHLSWGKVGVEIWTHKIDGLTESDFILAAKIDRLASPATGGGSG